MRRWLLTAALLLSLCPLARATKIVSQQTGNWGDVTSWVGGVVPGNKDEVKLFHVISTTDTRAVGVSVTTGSLAIDFQSTGTIHVTSTGRMIVRGYAQYTAGGANTTDAVDVDGGGAWEFDASLTTAPKNMGYSFSPSGGSGRRKFKVSGSSSAYASLSSNASSSTGSLTASGWNEAGVYEFFYANVTNMGFDLDYDVSSVGAPTKWDATYSSFTNCNLIKPASGGNMAADSTFRHEFNFHQGSVGASVFFMNFYSRNTTGIRSIKNNVFDAPMNDMAGQGLGDFNVQNNYLAQGFSVANATWAVFTNNFIRVNPKEANFGVGGSIVDSILWSDTDGQNPHIYSTTISSALAITGNVFEQAGIARTSSADDAGEFWLQTGPDIISTMTITNTIFLANGAGYSSLEITSLIGTANPKTYLNNRFVCEHNTYFGGWDNTGAGAVLPPFAALDYSETSNMGPGTIVSFRGNLLWNPLLSTRPVTPMLKALDVGNASGNLATGFGTGPTQDVCSPANCDFNGSYGATVTSATFTNSAAYTNQGRGYIGKFSSTPGVHDVDNQNPNFVDYKRYIEKFDSAYYRPYFGIAQPVAWYSTQPYNAGDIVSHSSGTYMWGDTLNYVYVSTGFCVAPSSNPEPGTLPISNWTRCWQTATVNDITRSILSSATFTDPAIGAVNADVNQTLLKWIRAGYRPTNTAFKGTAHDGGDIGAVPFAVPGKPIVTPSTNPVVTVGGQIQFVTSFTVTYSLTPGSGGSINASGLYSATTSFFTAAHVGYAGCPLLPNDDILNTDISNLPLNSTGPARVAFLHQNLITVSNPNGEARMKFENTMPTNVYSAQTPQVLMRFRSTPQAGGLFPMISTPQRMEEASNMSNDPFLQDHHILGVSSDTCMAAEQYQFYTAGQDPVVPLSNSTSGLQYYTMGYNLPDRSTGAGGGTDAAGMQIQAMLPSFSELKKGSINHVLRCTLNNGNLYGNNTDPTPWLWPATNYTAECSSFTKCFPYGSWMRLRSAYNCGVFSSGGSQVLCNTLKNRGCIFVDGGTVLGITGNYDLASDTFTFQNTVGDFNNGVSSISLNDLEQIDPSSLMISTFSGMVKIGNPYVVPANFVEVVATNILDGSSTTIRVAVQPPTVGFTNPAQPGLGAGINVMGGTPAFQIPFVVNGSTVTTATFSMSPTLGSLTAGGIYTAPNVAVTRITSTTVTITPDISAAQAISFPLVLLSSSGIFQRLGPATSGLDTIPPNTAAGDYVDVLGNTYLQDPILNLPNWDQRSTQGSSSWPNPDQQLYNALDHGAGDKVWSAMVPNGTYLFKASFASTDPADVKASTASIEVNGQLVVSSVTLAVGTLTPRTVTAFTTVSNNTFTWAIRGNDANSHVFASFFSLTPISAPVNKIINGGTVIGGKGTIF